MSANTTTATNTNRLLLEFHKTMKDVNRSVINPAIKVLKLSDLNPILEMVATARAAYITEMFKLAESLGNKTPTTEQLKQLRLLRLTFEEFAEGSKALETAIERGYLDVQCSVRE